MSASAPDQFPEFTTLPRVARALGVGVRQLRRAAASGELPTYRVGSWPRVRVRDVERWLDESRTRGRRP